MHPGRAHRAEKSVILTYPPVPTAVHSMSCSPSNSVLLLTQNASHASGGQQQATVIRDLCPRCQSPEYKKNGHIRNGKQNHQCHNCGRQFVDRFEQARVSDDTRALIERLLVERISLHGICRAVGVTLKWLLRFLGAMR
jgi:hypothetical protein